MTAKNIKISSFLRIKERMEKIDTIAHILHTNLTTNENRMLVDNGEIIIIIFDFIRDYKDMELLTTKIMW